MSNVAAVTKDNFKAEVLEHNTPVLVDFFATWCAPCKMLAPVVDKVAQEKEGSLKVVKLDTDISPEIGMQYNIRGVPTLILFKGGQEVDRHVGMLDYNKLTAMVGNHL